MKKIIIVILIALTSYTICKAQDYGSMLSMAKSNLVVSLQAGKAQDALLWSQALVTIQSGELLDCYNGILREFTPQIQSIPSAIKALIAMDAAVSEDNHESNLVLKDWINAKTKEDAEKAISRMAAAKAKDKAAAAVKYKSTK